MSFLNDSVHSTATTRTSTQVTSKSSLSSFDHRKAPPPPLTRRTIAAHLDKKLVERPVVQPCFDPHLPNQHAQTPQDKRIQIHQSLHGLGLGHPSSRLNVKNGHDSLPQEYAARPEGNRRQSAQRMIQGSGRSMSHAAAELGLIADGTKRNSSHARVHSQAAFPRRQGSSTGPATISREHLFTPSPAPQNLRAKPSKPSVAVTFAQVSSPLPSTESQRGSHSTPRPTLDAARGSQKVNILVTQPVKPVNAKLQQQIAVNPPARSVHIEHQHRPTDLIDLADASFLEQSPVEPIPRSHLFQTGHLVDIDEEEFGDYQEDDSSITGPASQASSYTREEADYLVSSAEEDESASFETGTNSSSLYRAIPPRPRLPSSASSRPTSQVQPASFMASFGGDLGASCRSIERSNETKPSSPRSISSGSTRSIRSSTLVNSISPGGLYEVGSLLTATQAGLPRMITGQKLLQCVERFNRWVKAHAGDRFYRLPLELCCRTCHEHALNDWSDSHRDAVGCWILVHWNWQVGDPLPLVKGGCGQCRLQGEGISCTLACERGPSTTLVQMGQFIEHLRIGEQISEDAKDRLIDLYIEASKFAK